MRARPDPVAFTAHHNKFTFFICAAAAVRKVEEEIMAELTRAYKLIEQHKQESSVVFDRMRRLDDVDKYTRKTIKILLTDKFQTVLLQQGVLENVATRVASLWARITVSDIHFEIR